VRDPGPDPGRGGADARRCLCARAAFRDGAMVATMELGGLRRCEVPGLRLDDLRGAPARAGLNSPG
jgi:integrase